MEDYWRDLDTMQRFAGAIGASEKVLEKFRAFKAGLMQPKTDSAPVVQPEPNVTRQDVVRLINALN